HPSIRPRAIERLDRAASAEDLVELGQVAKIVQLPEVQVIGAQSPEAVVEQPQRTIAGAIVRLGGEEDRLPRGGTRFAKGGAVIILALLIGRRGVVVADSEAQGLEDHRNRLATSSGGPKHALAAERDGQNHLPSATEWPLCRRWRARRCFSGLRGQAVAHRDLHERTGLPPR